MGMGMFRRCRVGLVDDVVVVARLWIGIHQVCGVLCLYHRGERCCQIQWWIRRWRICSWILLHRLLLLLFILILILIYCCCWSLVFDIVRLCRSHRASKVHSRRRRRVGGLFVLLMVSHTVILITIYVFTVIITKCSRVKNESQFLLLLE